MMPSAHYYTVTRHVSGYGYSDNYEVEDRLRYTSTAHELEVNLVSLSEMDTGVSTPWLSASVFITLSLLWTGGGAQTQSELATVANCTCSNQISYNIYSVYIKLY